MIISVIGSTDRRPVIYTLLKALEKFGDICLVSDNPQYRRLTEGYVDSGTFRNISVFVLQTTADQVFSDIEQKEMDFEYVIIDGILHPDASKVIMVQGFNLTEEEQDIIDTEENVSVIKLGFGSGCVPYTEEMFKAIEQLEAKQDLKVVSKKLLKKVAYILEEPTGIPSFTTESVVSRDDN